MTKGSCLCGAVTFAVTGDLGPPDACHCGQCRKQSGHYWASTDVPLANVTIEDEAALNWYQSSARARRGFCRTCGSFLFWRPEGRNSIAIAMGAFEGPTGIRLHEHIFVADKGDYYDIGDGLPQRE